MKLIPLHTLSRDYQLQSNEVMSPLSIGESEDGH